MKNPPARGKAALDSRSEVKLSWLFQPVMESSVPKLTEADMTLPVLQILSEAPNKTLPMSEIKNKLESVLPLSADDLIVSPTRSGEPMWRQIAGNITSHRTAEGNIIAEGLVEYVSKTDGLRLTPAGEAYLAKHGS